MADGIEFGGGDNSDEQDLLAKILKGDYSAAAPESSSTPQPPMAATPPASTASPTGTPADTASRTSLSAKMTTPAEPAPPAINTPQPALPSSVAQPNYVPPAPPSSNVGDLIQQRAKAAQPIDPKAIDPATGKQMYRMGIGQRILGTVGNALTGFGTGGRGPTTYVGPGATNERYDRDVAMQGQRVGVLDTQIKDTSSLDKENREAYQAATQAAYRGEIGEARLGTAAAQNETAATKASLADSQRQLNEARANRADQPRQPTNDFESIHQEALRRFPNNAKAAYDWEQSERIKNIQAARPPKDTSASDLSNYLRTENERRRALESNDRGAESVRTERMKEINAGLETKFPGPKRDAAIQSLEGEIKADHQQKSDEINQQYDNMGSNTAVGQKTQAAKKPLPGQRATPANAPATVQKGATATGKDGSKIRYSGVGDPADIKNWSKL